MPITPLISAAELQTLCAQLGQQISHDYAGKNLLLVGILKGCQPFLSDLSRQISLPVEISYMKIRSYTGIASNGNIHLELDTDIPITDREVLLVEDIIDTGTTMVNVCAFLQGKQPKSLKVVSLLDKPSRRTKPFQPDYVGKVIKDVFVVGYGFDCDEQYRNLPYVGVYSANE
ncbi:MAG: hypoxanthine phosphoribosyltransferase [Candidatus Peribacteria bacterium]|jgi:hypoxanthine phosphoribosyltransferase|nr:hypoxanthine phosphoribosyltransferase [Candidatus Peribacteria bacterium]